MAITGSVDTAEPSVAPSGGDADSLTPGRRERADRGCGVSDFDDVLRGELVHTIINSGEVGRPTSVFLVHGSRLVPWSRKPTRSS